MPIYSIPFLCKKKRDFFVLSYKSSCLHTLATSAYGLYLCSLFSYCVWFLIISLLSLHGQGKHAGVSLFLITNPPTVPQAPKGGFAILI